MIATTRKSVITTTHSGQITAADIRERFGLPPDARIVFEVPTGGDYSGQDIELDNGNPLRVSWETRQEDNK